MKPAVRLGMVNFINTAPLYTIWQEKVGRPEWQVTEAVPARLNCMLAAHQLDLAIVSSQEYALHPELYYVVDGLSISALGAVGSVYLFSRHEPTALGGLVVRLSPQSQTSNHLVRIILEEFCAVRPEFVLPAKGQERTSRYDAVLAIGDEALRLQQENSYPIALDLGEAWRNHTGLPFVFALWAVHRSFFAAHEETVAMLQRELRRCARQGKKELRRIAQKVASRIPMPVERCFAYLEGIQYDLDHRKKQSLELFFRYLIHRGEVPDTALPVAFCLPVADQAG